jgi:hypothetical protein
MAHLGDGADPGGHPPAVVTLIRDGAVAAMVPHLGLPGTAKSTSMDVGVVDEFAGTVRHR